MARVNSVVTDKFFRYFWTIGFIAFFFLALSIFTHGEAFLFWEYPLSDLGATNTVNGINNTLGGFFYWATMITSGCIMLTAAYAFHHMKRLRWKRWMVFLAIIAGIGFFIGVAPDDTADRIHQVGTTMFVSSLWLLTVLFLTMLHKHLRQYEEILWHAFFQSSILLYAFTYMLEHPSRQIFQKFSMVVLFLTLAVTSYLVYKKKAYK